MKMYLAGVETRYNVLFDIIRDKKLYWNLITYYGLRTPAALEKFERVKENSKQTLVDSGAFTLQRSHKGVDWVDYTKKYAKFIRKYDDDKITGFFEMDVDNIIGLKKVLELRSILEEVSDKIIPVWHKNRGIEGFKKLCKQYDYIAITGKNNDLKRNQFKIFVDYAHKHNTRIHGLGVSAFSTLDKVPFDSVDSTNWLLGSRFGKHPISGSKIDSRFVKENYLAFDKYVYLKYMGLQEEYYNKWKKICKWE